VQIRKYITSFSAIQQYRFVGDTTTGF